MSENKKIEDEVQARIEFKMKDILGGIQQAVNRNWHFAMETKHPKYAYYFEAFEEMKKMFEKEMWMPPPCDEMALKKKREAKDKAVDEIKNVIIRRGEHREDERHIIRTIVSAVEKAQNF